MGNGKNTIDILGIISWVLPLVLTIPIGLAVNIYTPRLQDWLAARSLSSKSKRVNVLKKELDRAVYYHNNMNKLYLRSAIVAFSSLLFLALGLMYAAYIAIFINIYFDFSHIHNRIINDVMTNMLLMVSTLPYLTAFISIRNHMELLSRVNKIEKYRKEITGQIKQIEAKTPKKKRGTTATG